MAKNDDGYILGGKIRNALVAALLCDARVDAISISITNGCTQVAMCDSLRLHYDGQFIYCDFQCETNDYKNPQPALQGYNDINLRVRIRSLTLLSRNDRNLKGLWLFAGEIVSDTGRSRRANVPWTDAFKGREIVGEYQAGIHAGKLFFVDQLA